jgi:hypothetical protein
MPADVGSQTISLKYGAPGNSREINERFVGVRETGIYSGGYLSVVDSSNAKVSALVCEITDGTHQVRVQTTTSVTLAVSQSTPVVVLRWAYTGDTTDFMQILAVSSGSVQTNDLVVGVCSFTGGGALNGFTYTTRTTPNTLDLFLKVEPTEDTELKVRIRAGRIQNSSQTINVVDQKSSVFVAPASNSRIDIVYVIPSTGVIAIAQGTAAASPVAPSYAGKIVLAEVTLTSTSTNITSSMVADKRNFVTHVDEVDGTSIEFDSNGKISIKDKGVSEAMLTDALSLTLARVAGTPTGNDSLGSLLAAENVYLAQADGFIHVVQAGGPLTQVLIGTANPPTTVMQVHTWTSSTTYSGLMARVPAGYYVKVTGNIQGSVPIIWAPDTKSAGNGLVKQ